MKVTRRRFIQISGATATGILLSQLGFDLSPIAAYAKTLRIKGAKETATICCYCSVGCGLIAHTDSKGTLINMEGDPDHPISEGALCAKGAAMYQLHNNPYRLTTPLYRAPYSTRWRKVTWDWALDKIARNIKKSRDATFVQVNANLQTVNRTDGIASLGSAAMDNEECWLYQKFLRSLGLVYIEHQARI
jgi:formate dehydrogenase major subunit